MPRWLNGLIVGTTIGLIGVLIAATPTGSAFEQNIGLAWLFKVRGAIEPPPDVAVVAINNRAIEGLDLSTLPRDWPRSIHAHLVRKLVERGASAIIFDMDFQRPKEAKHDLKFANAIAKSKRVILFQRLEGKRQPVIDINGQQTGTIWVEKMIPPIPELANSARALAPFPVPKVQVDIFQFWTFKSSADNYGTLPSAALQVHALRVYDQWLEILRGVDPEFANQLPPSDTDLVNATDTRDLMRQLRQAFTQDSSFYKRVISALSSLPPQVVNEADKQLMTALANLYQRGDNPYLNFYGPPGTIPTIPYNAVIGGNDSNSNPTSPDFTDKVVFVGFSDLFDPGQPDRFYTVFSREDGVDLSGVEIAATAFANLLTDRTLKPSSTAFTAMTLLLFGVILGASVFLLPALIGVPFALLISIVFMLEVQFAFNAEDLWLPLATPIFFQLPMALFIGLFAQYLLERRKERRVSKAISYYLPADVAAQLTESELDHATLNKVVYGVCLATDMSGFTAISETLSPEKLAKFMNNYFDTLASALKRHQVDVTEFHADTIMCAWTAPNPQSLERHKAALASLAVVEAIEHFNQSTQNINLNARIGLDEGNFYLGHTGGGGRMGYSILGDCANTAARLESLNKHLGTHVLAAESVVENLQEFLLRPVGQFILVGKSDPISVVEIIATMEAGLNSDTSLIDNFEEALQFFNNNNWHEASIHFKAILRENANDGPSRFYLDLCHSYRIDPPDFENPSVVRMNSK